MKLIQNISDRNLSSSQKVRRIHSALSFGKNAGDLDALASVRAAGDDDRFVSGNDLADWFGFAAIGYTGSDKFKHLAVGHFCIGERDETVASI